MGFATDFWSMGCIIFEMNQGFSPFRGDTEQQIFNNIIKGDIQFPIDCDGNLQSLVTLLLEKDPTTRENLCSFEKLKDHPFFRGINWRSV